MKISISIGSDILYHITGLTAAANILTSNRFELKPSEGTDAEHAQAAGKFYLSTARSRTSAYLKRNAGSYSVILVLDGRSLGHKYKIIPVDYWETNRANEKLERRATANEMEDRVLSDRQFIPRAATYIREVHAHVNDKKKILFTLKKRSLLHKIPIFFYDTVDNLLALNKAKAISVAFNRSDIRDTEDPESAAYRRKREVYKFRNAFLRRWIELYKTPIKTEDAWDTVKTLPKDHGQRGYSILRYSDAVQSFKADLHNAKSIPYGDASHEREYLDELVALMRKNRQTPEAFIEALRDKWFKRE